MSYHITAIQLPASWFYPQYFFDALSSSSMIADFVIRHASLRFDHKEIYVKVGFYNEKDDIALLIYYRDDNAQTTARANLHELSS